MKTPINTMTLTALALSGALLAAPLTSVLAEETASAPAQEAAKGEMSGMQEMMVEKREMMENRQEMMEKHMTKMEDHMANIEALLRELVELNKAK
jgi:hypothetical protein